MNNQSTHKDIPVINTEVTIGGQYKLSHKISDTLTGEIWLGFDMKAGNNKVLLKKFAKPKELFSVSAQHALTAETRLIHIFPVLQHPLFPILLRSCYHMDYFYAAFDYSDGTLLDSLTKTSEPAAFLKTTIKWGLQICQLFENYIKQEYPIFLPPLAPETVLITKDDNIKLLICGIETAFGGEEAKTGFTLQESSDEHENGKFNDSVQKFALILLHILTAGKACLENGSLIFSISDCIAPPQYGPLLHACLNAFEANQNNHVAIIYKELRRLNGEDVPDEIIEETFSPLTAKKLVSMNITANLLSTKINNIMEKISSSVKYPLKTINGFLKENTNNKQPVAFTNIISPIKSNQTMSLHEQSLFYRQLAILYKSAIPVPYALEIIAKGSSKSSSIILLSLREKILKGLSFSEAMHDYPNIFPIDIISIVTAGEEGGTLQETLEELADSVESTLSLTNQVKSTLSYPIFILITSIIVVLGLTKFMLPPFLEMFNNMRMPIPATTKLILNIAKLMTNDVFWYFAAINVVIFFIWVKTMHKTTSWKQQIDEILIKTPITRKIVTQITATRFCRTLAELCRSGIPVYYAAKLASAAVGNNTIETQLKNALVAVTEGDTLSHALKDHVAFPSAVSDFIAVGEQSGELQNVLLDAANFFFRETKIAMDTAQALLGPLIIIILGFIIGCVMLSVFIPLYSAISSFGG